MKRLLAAAAAVALVVGYAADGFANPKVKFSDSNGDGGNNASVDGNSILSGNTGGPGADPSGPGGNGIDTGGGNIVSPFESNNTDIEVITNKELEINVSDIVLDWTAGDGGPGSTGTVTSTCTDEAQCDISIVTDVSGTPQGGNGGSPQINTGGVSIALGPCQGFCNVIGNTGFANANVAETAATFHVTVGGGVNTPGGG